MLLSEPTREHYDGMLLTLRSAPTSKPPRSRAAASNATSSARSPRNSTAPDAEVRAALLVAICTGIQFMRDVLRNNAFTDGDPDVLARYLRDALAVVAVNPDC